MTWQFASSCPPYIWNTHPHISSQLYFALRITHSFRGQLLPKLCPLFGVPIANDLLIWSYKDLAPLPQLWILLKGCYSSRAPSGKPDMSQVFPLPNPAFLQRAFLSCFLHGTLQLWLFSGNSVYLNSFPLAVPSFLLLFLILLSSLYLSFTLVLRFGWRLVLSWTWNPIG